MSKRIYFNLFFNLCCVLFASLFLNACSVHRLDVQQGNIITDAQVAKLKVGISKRQVRFIMGTPLLYDPFHHNRWDYVFSMQPGKARKIVEYQRITIYFEQGKLSKYDNIYLDQGELKPILKPITKPNS